MGIIIILLLAFILRIINLNQSFWLDEAVQVVVSKGSFNEILANLSGDFHPPLYHFLIWLYLKIFPANEIFLRMPSVIFSVLAVYGVFLISKELFKSNNLCVYLAAILFATAPFHIYYSQEARMYSLVTFAAVFSMLFFIRLLEGKKNAKYYYILFSIIMILSDYFGFLVLGSQILYLIIKKKFNYLKYPIISFLPFIFWLPNFLFQIKTGNEAVKLLPEWGRLVNLSFYKALPLTVIKFTIGRITIFNKTLYAVFGGTIFAIYNFLLSFFIFKFKSIRDKTIIEPVFFWLFFPLFATLIISFYVPSYQPFRLLLILPAFCLFLSYCLTLFKGKLPTYFIFGIFFFINLVSLSQYYTNPYFQREDWRNTTKFLQNTHENSLIILPSNTNHFPLSYYSNNQLNFYGIADMNQVGEQQIDNLSLKAKGKKEIYFINYLTSVFDPQNKIINFLSKDFQQTSKISFNQIEILVYTLK